MSEEISQKKAAYYKRKRENMSMNDAISVFKADIVWGAIYPCVSCHRTCFRNSVVKANIEKLNDLKYFELAVNLPIIYNNAKFYIKGSYWICHTCHAYIKRNSLPKIYSKFMNSLTV